MLFEGKTPGATITFPTIAMMIEFQKNTENFLERQGTISFRELRTIAKLSLGNVKKLRNVGGGRFTVGDIHAKKLYNGMTLWFPDQSKGDTRNEP